MSASQLSLFERAPARDAAGHVPLRRTPLDAHSWIDVAPGFLPGDLDVMNALEAELAWRHERRVMYEREVDVPRLVAITPNDVHLHPRIAEVASLLAARYDASFEHVSFALYRHGRDSVAWHRDKMPRDRPTLVAILALGAPRPLLVRRFMGGPSRAFALGGGDLFVMGGWCQRDWEHCVPKRRAAGPRLSCMFRFVYPAVG